MLGFVLLTFVNVGYGWMDTFRNPVKTSKLAQDQYSRTHTLTYMIPVGVSKVSVCKHMFLRTLGLKTDGRVTEFVLEKLISLNVVCLIGMRRTICLWGNILAASPTRIGVMQRRENCQVSTDEYRDKID